MIIFKLFYLHILSLCEVMDLNPVPILMSIVVHANIGGTMTPVGDPPNIIITSNPYIMHHVRCGDKYKILKNLIFFYFIYLGCLIYNVHGSHGTWCIYCCHNHIDTLAN